MNQNHLWYLALGGVLGPLIFTLTFIICASLRQGYSHVHQLISEIGATGTSHAKMIDFAGFLPSGVMISVLGLSQALLLPKNTFKHIGSVLIVLIGLGVATAGVFTCDEGCPPQS